MSRGAWKRIAVVSAISAVLFLWVVPNIPVPFSSGYSLNEIHQICTSGLGEIAQAFSQQAGQTCGHWNVIHNTVSFVGWASVVIAVLTAARVFWLRERGAGT